jgi:hypothetical protein
MPATPRLLLPTAAATPVARRAVNVVGVGVVERGIEDFRSRVVTIRIVEKITAMAVPRATTRIGPDVRLEVGVIKIDPVVDNRNHNRASASPDQVPGTKGAHILKRHPATLPGVVQMPLVAELGIVDCTFADLGEEIRRRKVDDVVCFGKPIGEIQRARCATHGCRRQNVALRVELTSSHDRKIQTVEELAAPGVGCLGLEGCENLFGCHQLELRLPFDEHRHRPRHARCQPRGKGADDGLDRGVAGAALLQDHETPKSPNRRRLLPGSFFR